MMFGSSLIARFFITLAQPYQLQNPIVLNLAIEMFERPFKIAVLDRHFHGHP